MPTVLTWPYKEPGCELNEIQRVVPGDKGNDDLLGEVTIIGMEGADLIIEDGTVDDSGKAVTRLRTSWHIQALQQKEAVAVREPTGRPGQRPGGMIAFLGLGGSPVVHGKRPASNAKGLGGKAPTAPHSNRKAIAPHRTAFCALGRGGAGKPWPRCRRAFGHSADGSLSWWDCGLPAYWPGLSARCITSNLRDCAGSRWIAQP